MARFETERPALFEDIKLASAVRQTPVSGVRALSRERETISTSGAIDASF